MQAWVRAGLVAMAVAVGCGEDEAESAPGPTGGTLPDGAPVGTGTGLDGGAAATDGSVTTGDGGFITLPDGAVIPKPKDGGVVNDDAGPPKPPVTGLTQFTEVTSQAGIGTLESGMNWAFDCAIEDFDNDDKLDVFLGDHDSANNQNRLGKNSGTGTFTAVATAAIKNASSGGVWSLSLADFNNDGFMDAIPNWDASNTSTFLNNGAGSFTNLAMSSMDHQANGMVWGDYDGDGLLDFAVSNFNGTNRLWHRKTAGTASSDWEQKAGVMATGNASTSLYMADLNGDHFPDIVMQTLTGNVFQSTTGCSTKVLFNKGVKGASAGFNAPVTAGLDNAPCFGIAMGDYDNDGDLDLIGVGSAAAGSAPLTGTNIKLGMALLRNDGTGNFSDVTGAALLPTTTSNVDVYAHIYDQAVFTDLDQDGYLDLIVSLGKNSVYRNLGNRTFQDVTTTWKLSVTGGRPARVFVGDIDADGDVDLLTQTGQAATIGYRLWRNDLGSARWLTVRAAGTKIKSALGSKISLYEAGHAGDAAFLRGYREVITSTSHRSPLEQYFGTETGKNYDVQVRFWPDGTVVTIPNQTAGKRLRINENGTSAVY
ncbi:MAG: VCBS repeat-containing protein [Myxococcales bacterium]|nr:VCBS repeat-containing protein [Myxococcales bacterium]